VIPTGFSPDYPACRQGLPSTSALRLTNSRDKKV
jgi:hypothetical protein